MWLAVNRRADTLMIDKQKKCVREVVTVFSGLLLLCCQIRAEVDCNIVIATGCKAEVKAAAQDMSSILSQMTAKQYPVVTDEVPIADREIVVGRNKHLEALGVVIGWKNVGSDGYTIRKAGDRLIIVGGPDRGTLNGIYVFLEEYLGCRWYAPDCTVIPKRQKLEFGDIAIERRPVLKWRGLTVQNSSDSPRWAARNRANYLNQSTTKSSPGWNKMRRHPLLTGIWHEARWHIHELGHLLPAEEYFDEHPEYFSLIRGERLKDRTQPCLTNPDVLQEVTERVRLWIAADGGGRLMDLSMNDWGNWCRCPKCKASYLKYERNGTLLWFVNKVAQIIEKEHPEVMFTAFLSYMNYRGAPLGDIRPRHNVIAKVSYVSQCRYHSLEECGRNLRHGYARDLRDWCALTPGRVIFWLSIYGLGPKMHGLERTYRHLRDLGVTGVVLDNHPGQGPKYLQLRDLEEYLHAKLQWDPDTDVNETVREFCGAFYGAAALEMVQVFHVMNDGTSYTMEGISPPSLANFPGFHMENGAPLTLEGMTRLDERFEAAVKKVHDDTVRLKRVRQARLFVQYNILSYAPQDGDLFARAVRDFPVAAGDVGLTAVTNRHLHGGTKQGIDAFMEAMSKPGRGVD